MTNKEKTVLFLKALCVLILAGSAVISGASVLNGGANAFVKATAVITIVTNLGIAGKIVYDKFLK